MAKRKQVKKDEGGRMKDEERDEEISSLPSSFIPHTSSFSSSLPDYEESVIVNDETGEMQTVRTKLGYAPAPLPFGWRPATEAEMSYAPGSPIAKRKQAG